MQTTIIRNGHVIDPESGLDGLYDLVLQGDCIQSISPAGAGGAEATQNIAETTGTKQAESASQNTTDFLEIDASGQLVLPGFVDVHVHFRDPGFTAKEDIETGARAAAKGGYTSVIMMANTKPTIDNEETLRYVLEKGKTTGIHCYACANVTMGMKGEVITPMEDLAKAGAVGFTDDGIPLVREEIVKEAMERAAKLGMPISFHEEDPAFITNNGINKGKASEHFGIGGSPREAEISLISRDLKLGEGTGASIDIQHISTKEGVELVRQARKAGMDVHAEATPHHFSLTEEAAIAHGTLAKMNPPLRTEEDRLAIIAGLADGTIDMIATDHAPHTAQEKAKELTQAPSGIIGLETALPLAITNLIVPGKLDYAQLVRALSTNPAKLYHLPAGSLKVGGPADLVLIDPNRKEVVAEPFASKATNTPFTGCKLQGKVMMTICAGKIVYQA